MHWLWWVIPPVSTVLSRKYHHEIQADLSMWLNLFMSVLSKKVKKSFWLSGCNVVSWLSASSESAGFSWCWTKSECKPVVAVSPLAVAMGSLNLLMEKNWEFLDLDGSFVSSGFVLKVHQEPRDGKVVGWRPCCHFVSLPAAGHKCQEWFWVCSVNLARMSREMFNNICNVVETDASNVSVWLICIRNCGFVITGWNSVLIYTNAFCFLEEKKAVSKT